MNTYKTFFLLLFMLMVTFLVTSCKKDFLNVEDGSLVAREDYVTDLTTTGHYLNGIYTRLGFNLYDGYNQIYPELIADNMKLVTAASPNLNTHYYWNQSVQGTNMNNFWQLGYLVISSCNFTIGKAEQYRNQDPAKADDMKAQCLAIRALVHFLMVNIFAQPYNFTAGGSHPGIPYVKTSDWTVSITREPVATVYADLISDLTNAMQLFPASPTTVTSSNKTLAMNLNAARALLARVYLFKEDYQSAKNLAKEVSTITPIMTGSNYPSKLFTQQETEALFQLNPSWTAVSGGTYSAYFMGVYLASPLQQFLATSDIASILTENSLDVRNGWVTQQSANTWRVSKYPANVVSGFPVGTQAYFPTVLRSSEMYLTAAESYAKLGNEDSARFYLNAIRIRANVSASPTLASGTALLDSIYKERRKELSFEGLRMFDLQRWKKDVSRMDAWSPTSQNLVYPNNKAIAPIPETDVTIGGLTQNTGY